MIARLASLATGQDVRFGGPDVAFSEINKRTSSDLGRTVLFTALTVAGALASLLGVAGPG